MARTMGIDLGDKRVGVAVSDELGITAQGVATIQRAGLNALIDAIGELVREKEVTRIVVGLPLNMNGSEGPRAEGARAFATRVEEALGIPCALWDERLTTRAAERVLIEGEVSRKKRRAVIDQLAAQLILQGFLDSERAAAHVDDES
jgi:putative Holliday junction resolvase